MSGGERRTTPTSLSVLFSVPDCSKNSSTGPCSWFTFTNLNDDGSRRCFFFQKEKGCAFRSDDALAFVLHGLQKGKGFAFSTSRKEGHGWKPRHMADLDSYYTVDDVFSPRN